MHSSVEQRASGAIVSSAEAARAADFSAAATRAVPSSFNKGLSEIHIPGLQKCVRPLPELSISTGASITQRVIVTHVEDIIHAIKYTRYQQAC